jgi:hypothetical protein
MVPLPRFAGEDEAATGSFISLFRFVLHQSRFREPNASMRHSESKKGESTMPSSRRRDRGRRRILREPRTEWEEAMQRQGAFAAIKKLYCEALPLWRVCGRGLCRRNQRCCGEAEACLIRCWPRFPVAEQNRAWREVGRGGPRRLPPATAMEKGLRRYPSSNFVL